MVAKWTLALVMTAATVLTGSAQQRDAGNLGLAFPVPVWPSNGVVSPEMKGQYVFVDLAKNEYIVAYPENLGSPNMEKDGPGLLQVNRYKLQRDVEPKITVTVNPSAGGKFKYTYTVNNAPNAKQSIGQFALALPDAAGTSTAKPGTGWFGIVQKNRKLPVANPAFTPSGAAAVFSVDKIAEQVMPGSKKGGFEIESDMKPGFQVGFFRQTESTDAFVQASGNIPTVVVKNATPPPPPAGSAPPAGGGGGGFGGGGVPAGATTAWQPIKDAIDKLTSIEYNSKPTLVLAPKFDKSATDKAIATDFMQGIQTLSRMGGVSGDSAFVKAALADLDAYVKAGGTGQFKPSAQPSGETETEIFNAMKVSLHF